MICGDRGDFEPGGRFCFTKTEKRKKETLQGGSEGLDRKDFRFDSDD